MVNETQPAKRIVMHSHSTPRRIWNRLVAIVESGPAQMCGFAIIGGVVSYMMFTR